MGKLILIEGIDRTGKDSLVAFLASYFFEHRDTKDAHIQVNHWGFPPGETNAERIAYQKKDFKQKAKDARKFFEKNPDGIIIWNRSHIGEYVYGPLYRDENTDWLKSYEEHNIIEHLHNTADIYLFLLDGNIDFLLGQDDGDSFTTKKEIKLEEQVRFKDAFVNSEIKNKLYIPVADAKGYYPLTDIQDQVIKKLNE